MNLSDQYRAKALACEKLAREASDYDIRCAWGDIAIEWHALANRVDRWIKKSARNLIARKQSKSPVKSPHAF